MDPYKVLGVKPTASEAEIKKEYKKLCQKYHPDRGSGDEVKYKEITEAYRRITEPEKFAHERPAGGQTGGGFRGFGDFADFQHLFPLTFTTTATLEELFMGCTKPINLVGVQSFTIEIPRRHHPDGEIRGQVTMPNGNPRQVVCKVNPKKHPDFELRGLDLYCTREISLMEHYRGTNIRVKVLDGKEFIVKVPPGKQNPTIKMSGKGFALPNNQAGDLYIEVKVKLPVLDNAQIEQLKNILQKVDVSV